jgi:phage terminase Nu1 subunit (DNA packaging protein)
MASVSVHRVAEIFGVSVRRINQLGQAGMPREGHGQYDLSKCCVWYIRHLQKALELTGPDHSADIRAGQLRLLKARSEKLQIGNAVACGELVEGDFVQAAWTRRLMNCKMRLRAIPSSLGPQLTNKSDPTYIVERLGLLIDEALTELTDGSPDGLGGAGAR